MSDSKSIGSVEYMRQDGKIDGGRIVETIELYANDPAFTVDSSGFVSIADKGSGKTRKYVVAIAEVD